MQQTVFHVISHTHWDREWYLPFEVFRLELVELIDRLLNLIEKNKDFIFHLDGQTIILQDYLEIKPHKKEQIKKFVKSGNLLIGPWYVLSDQFLSSGEATIRNLLYGIRDTKEFGNAMLVGYCPDQFGQIAQLPQIFRSFNINSAILGRGIQDSIAEHKWVGLNGENILAISLTHWYNNAQNVPAKDTHKYIDKIFETHSKTTLSNHILLMNGCDHLYAQEDLPTILKSLDSNQKWQLKQDTLPKAIQNIISNPNSENYPICFGELRSDNNKYILAGTLSSRVYLKLMNYKCQTLLEKVIEPLATILSIQNKLNYPFDEIKYAWKLLIQNHAHDSICGCSLDEVHREMEIRFLKVNQVLDKLKENLLSTFSNDSTKQYLQVTNLTNYYRKEVIEAELELPLGPVAEHASATPTINKPEIKNITLKHDSREIHPEILESYQTYRMVRSKHEVPLLQAFQKIKILFEANIKPYSIISYEISTDEKERKAMFGSNREVFQNEQYKLDINKNGSFSVHLKEANHKFEDIHFLSIEDDKGDEYNFVPNELGEIVLSTNWKWNIRIIEENNLRKKILLTSNEVVNIKHEITCYSNSRRIDIKTNIQNTLKNKRIRLHIPTHLQTNYITADTPFGIIRRSRPPVDWINYANSQPLYNWIDHNNDLSGLAFFGGGLADYELYKDGNGFAITLIRAVERLSTVKSHSLIETPEAQCNREIEFSYSILPHADCWETSLIQDESLIYQTPLNISQSDSCFNLDSFITVSPKLTISSLKRAEDKENIFILRVFNPTNEQLSNCEIKVNFDYKKISSLTLSEEILDTFKQTKIAFQAKPFQILTFGIEV